MIGKATVRAILVLACAIAAPLRATFGQAPRPPDDTARLQFVAPQGPDATAASSLNAAAAVPAQPPAEPVVRPAPDNQAGSTSSSGTLAIETASIDLPSALALAGVQNPQLNIARQRVAEAVAQRQLAAAQLLPNLVVGANYDDHTGAIQQSSGQMLNLQRQALYVGAGANAVGSGTPVVPGIQYDFNVSTSIFGFLSVRQTVQTQQLTSIATRNQVLLDVAVAYIELLRAEGRLAVAMQIRSDVAEVARLTNSYASTGVGRKADAHRAATEVTLRTAEIQAFEGDVQIASARLARLLHLDPSIRLKPTDAWVVPAPLVPPAAALSELIGTALLQHPDLAAQRSAIRAAFFDLQAQRLLPFSPQVMVGFSAGNYGGGGNTPELGVQSDFYSFNPRVDIQLVTYWTLQNLGLGNRALISAARARLGQRDFRQLEVLNQVRYDVASAYARAYTRYAQLPTYEQAVRAASDAFREDFTRIRSRQGLPIEVLNSLRLLADARLQYLTVVTDYNRSQFELYVALGQPPVDLLAQPAVVQAARPIAAGSEAPRPPAPPAELSRPAVSPLPPQEDGGSAASRLPLQGGIVPAEAGTEPINLEAAWRLAGVQNPTINLARQVLYEAEAMQRKARLVWFPNLNAGAMYYSHVGNWQDPSGQMRNLTDQSFYIGSGAYTMGAQTNAIPGVQLTTQLTDAIYNPLAARQIAIARSFDVSAQNNVMLLAATRAYLDLLQAQAQWEAFRLSHADLEKLVEATQAYAQTGIGRKGDADRMQAEGFLVQADLQWAEGQLAVASAALARLVQLDPTVRLRTPDSAMRTFDLVELGRPLEDLLQVALRRRPELGSRDATISASRTRVRQEQMRPLLPLISLGYSGGGFGGTGNYIPNPPFTSLFDRTDFDVMAVWTVQNAGMGNVALIRGSRATLNDTIYQRRDMVNQVRMEVTSAYASALSQRRQVTVSLRRLTEAELAFQEDFRRLRGGGALPIEVLNSVRLLVRARQSLVDAFVNDNRAQFDLFVAMGQPPYQASQTPAAPEPGQLP